VRPAKAAQSPAVILDRQFARHYVRGMDILYRTSGHNLGDIVLSKHFIVMDRPRLTGVLLVRQIEYVGYPKEWGENSFVQVIAGGREYSLYMTPSDAKQFVDILLALLEEL